MSGAPVWWLQISSGVIHDQLVAEVAKYDHNTCDKPFKPITVQ